MAATGLLALFDDMTALLDDVAAASRQAASQTAGLAGDDLAVNAERLVGLAPARELPIVGKVALGSAANKLVLIPLALALPSAAIQPVLILGGTYLCYEGAHKVLHKVGHHDDPATDAAAPVDPAVNEAQRVRQAIITDVILSAEIVAVALGTVADEPFATRAITLTIVAYAMTALIYGFVALIVKLDDIGLHLQKDADPGSLRHQVGHGLVVGTPYLMRAISILGTGAMFLVGGGIIAHGLHLLEPLHLHGPLESLGNFAVGVAVGGIAWLIVEGVRAVIRRVRDGGAEAH